MNELLSLNVNDKTEKKGGLTYLSWAWAWAEVLKIDPKATWVAHTYGPQGSEQPCMWIGETAIVHTSVTINGLRRECMLPVMDNRNNAVKNPDSRKVSDAIMRCMTKAISMHGLGLYIYAGEDLPMSDGDSLVPALEASIEQAKEKKRTGVMADVLASLPPLADDEVAYFNDLAADVELIFSENHEKKGQAAAFDRIEQEKLSNDEKLHLWSRLGSKVRTALRVEGGLRIGAN